MLNSFEVDVIEPRAVDWFFAALTTLYNDAMHLGCTVVPYDATSVSGEFQDWKFNFFKRRPFTVFRDIELLRNQARDPTLGGHFVLAVIVPLWEQRQLRDYTVRILVKSSRDLLQRIKKIIKKC
jgi:hypothetical protein